MGCRAFALLAAPLVLRAPEGPAVGPGCLVCPWAVARPRAVRAASFARRVVSKPGQAPPPPTGTAARPSGPSGALRTSGAGCADRLLGASARCSARPCRPRVGLQSGEACGWAHPGPAAREARWLHVVRRRASKPARALRSLRSLRSLRHPPHRWSLVCCVVLARPRRRLRASRPDLACPIAEPTPNFARNSLMALSNHEFISLELQRFQTLLNVHPIE